MIRCTSGPAPGVSTAAAQRNVRLRVLLVTTTTSSEGAVLTPRVQRLDGPDLDEEVGEPLCDVGEGEGLEIEI